MRGKAYEIKLERSTCDAQNCYGYIYTGKHIRCGVSGVADI